MLVQVGRARFRAPELLFHPVLIGEESEGIHQVSCLSEATMSCAVYVCIAVVWSLVALLWVWKLYT